MARTSGFRVFAGLVVAVLCLGALSACGSDDDGDSTESGTTAAATGKGIDSSKPPWRIPVISIKIPGLDLLTPQAAGAKAAAEQINAEGGFGGREVVIEECATQLTPATATVCANQTLEKGNVLGEIGCEVTWAASGLKIYSRAGVPSFNCANELSDEWNFNAHPGTFGEHAAVAEWMCRRDDIEQVVMIGQDLPQQRREEPAATKPIIEGCGKQIDFVFAPIEVTDFTPYVNEALDHDPDFIITQQSPAPTAQLYKTFQQAGYPADQTSAVGSSCGYEEVLELAGASMEGVHCLEGFRSWSDEDDPEIAEYIEAMEAQGGYDYRSSSPQWGYSGVKWIEQAAEAIGFDKLTPRKLAEYLRTDANGESIPLSRTWVYPGPGHATSITQPATLFNQWKDGEMHTVEEETDEGWINGFEALEGGDQSGS
jgi:ABC-type branched-subunit amino acid transport system substrate-binding protein